MGQWVNMPIPSESIESSRAGLYDTYERRESPGPSRLDVLAPVGNAGGDESTDVPRRAIKTGKHHTVLGMGHLGDVSTSGMGSESCAVMPSKKTIKDKFNLRRGSCGSRRDGKTHEHSSDSEHGNVHGGSLDHGSDHGDDGGDGDTPFPSKLITDGTGERHGDYGTSEDDSHVQGNQGGVQVEVLRVRWQDLKPILFKVTSRTVDQSCPPKSTLLFFSLRFLLTIMEES